MLIYFCTKPHRYTVEPLLEIWGPSLKSQVRVVAYEDAAQVRPEGVTSVIFSDYDRLSPELRNGFGKLADLMIRRGVRVLNHPQHSLLRAELLRELHAAKLNSFRAIPAHRLPRPGAADALRFPVFMRLADEHKGPASNLLHSPLHLHQSLHALRSQRIPLDGILVVEFCDTARNGWYRKYSCFFVDGVVLPRHMFVSKEWVVKVADLVTPEVMEEEAIFLEGNPHEEQVRRVFRLANVGYGRIDYSFSHDQMQVWEINCNPYVMFPPEKYNPLQLDHQRWFVDRLIPLFEKLGTG
jgi:hypothetical protein